MPSPQMSSFNINSRHFSDRIDNDIVQLTKTLSVEYSISIEDAKLMARKMIQRKLNSILTDEEKEGTKEVCNATKRAIKCGVTDSEYFKNVYELLKMLELL